MILDVFSEETYSIAGFGFIWTCVGPWSLALLSRCLPFQARLWQYITTEGKLPLLSLFDHVSSDR
jgi:hypothetical protein